MASRFEERLASGPPLVADGGMGAVVGAAVAGLRCPEEANLRAPDSVVSVHVAYIRAGAEVIETNTFGANRPKLGAHFLEDEFERINSTAVRLAREAREVAGRDVFVAGSVGPLGDVELRQDDRSTLFAEQARVLEGRGVDLFMVETFYDLDELVTAIGAVRAVSSLPIVALMTFGEDGETLAGVTAAEAARRLRGLGLAAIGANHGAGPAAALAALAEMQGDGMPLAALPNVGLASLSGTRIVYPHASPDYFGEFAAQARALGAALIGGCCGTTPTQIEAIAAAVAADRKPAAPFVLGERELVPAAPEAARETELERLLNAGEFVVSVQLDPPLGGSNRGLLEAARAIRESGRAQVVDVNDNPRARASMSGIMASVAIERFAGIETIPHLTPRDATVAGLESLLLGAHAEGVRNVLAVTGDPPESGDYPGLSGGVYQVDAIGLVEVVERLNGGADWHGRDIDAPTSFFPGVAVNPTADDLDEELRRFELKVEAGARFAMTQVLFDLEPFDAFAGRLGGWPIPVLVGIWPLRSHALAVRIHNEVPGIVVPEPVQDRLRDAGAGAPDAGFELARALLAEAREKAAGAYLVAPFRRPLAVLDLFS